MRKGMNAQKISEGFLLDVFDDFRLPGDKVLVTNNYNIL
jgi:hypothetical protein